MHTTHIITHTISSECRWYSYKYHHVDGVGAGIDVTGGAECVGVGVDGVVVDGVGKDVDDQDNTRTGGGMAA